MPLGERGIGGIGLGVLLGFDAAALTLDVMET